MNKLRQSWSLLKSSLQVLARNKKLLVFPIVISICTMAIILFFLAPPILRPTGQPYTSAEHWKTIGHSLATPTSNNPGGQSSQWSLTPAAAAYLVFLYFVSMLLATFFNVAFYHEILAALAGQAVSITRGLKFACTRWKAVLAWTAFAGLVGLLIKMIEQRFSLVGRIISRLLGVAWSIASVFVIPVIVREEQSANPVAILKKSGEVVVRAWGEGLIGYVGFAAANILFLLASLGLLGVGVAVSAMTNNYWIIAVAGAVWLLALLAWSYFSSVAGQVYKGALFVYAAEGNVPHPYDHEMLQSAWKFKKP
jgi:hypothetical protein